MASPFTLTNTDLQFLNADTQDFVVYIAFLNPVSFTTNWNDLNMDAQGNWLPPPNYDTAAHHVQPYAPTANLGSNRIGFAGEPLYFDGSRSCQRFDLPVVSYSWTVSGSPDTTFYDNNAQMSCTWPSPGLYTVSLNVTDKAGTHTTGTRQIMIYQDRESALGGLITISGLSGSLSNGGWQCQITTVNSQITLFPPDALAVGTYQPVVLFIETRFEVVPGTWISRTIGPHGQFTPGHPYADPRIFFDGYVQSGTIHQDVDKDTLSFSCLGPQMVLQEMKTHQLGYYNCASGGSDSHGNTTSLKVSAAGKGFQVGGLQSVDVIHSILQTHTTFGLYHDIHCWNPGIPTQPYDPKNKQTSYSLQYTTLSVNEGTVWDNLNDLTTNEWATMYCGHDGGIFIGPQINYRGGDYWSQPTLLGETQASAFINFIQDLGYDVGSDLTAMTANLPALPAQPMPVKFVHPWGNQPNPPLVQVPFQGTVDSTVLIARANQTGPPILCVFSDTPIYDGDPTPVGHIFPWLVTTWPQDLGVYPFSFDFPEKYTGRTSLVKLIGTLFGATTLWTCWYPQNTFSVAGDGVSTIITKTLPAGNWSVNDSHVLPDITTGRNKQLVLNWWWEIAKRDYFAQNMVYTGTVTLGIFTATSLGDIVAITRQNNTLGPHWAQKPFYVTDISYSIDLTNHLWSTTIGISEVTSATIGPITPPPKKIPKV